MGTYIEELEDAILAGQRDIRAWGTRLAAGIVPPTWDAHIRECIFQWEDDPIRAGREGRAAGSLPDRDTLRKMHNSGSRDNAGPE